MRFDTMILRIIQCRKSSFIAFASTSISIFTIYYLFHTNQKDQPSYVIFIPHANSYSYGIGNCLFEILGMHAISEHIGRTPLVACRTNDEDCSLREKLYNISQMLPNILQFNDIHSLEVISPRGPKVEIMFSKACCKFNEYSTEYRNFLREPYIRMEIKYMQSFKYWSHFSPTKLERLLEQSDVSNSQYKLLLDRLPKPDDYNICVHIRRGDFVISPCHEPSQPDFTLAAATYAYNQAIQKGLNATVIVIGNDGNWTEEVFRNATFPYKITHERELPTAEWSFSRKHCDEVILTASVSTYGWWLGYFSKGNTVRYNTQYSPPGSVFNEELEPETFFLPHWIPLTLVNNSIIESWL